jgi:TolA-binding protein
MKMRTKLLIIVSLFVLIIGSSTVSAQEKGAKETKPHEGTMMWSAMVGAGFLHDYMNSMIQQMSGMIRVMSQMMNSSKMDEKNMKRMSEIMAEMSTMMNEIPAVEEMMAQIPR